MYYWRVVATNAAGSASSSTISFTTLTPPVTGPVLVSGLSNPTGLAVDTDTVYWTEFGGLIRKASKANGIPVTLFASQYNPSGIAVDDANVYFGDGLNIRSVPKGGGTSAILAAATPSQIAVDSSNIYWTDFGAGAIRKMPKSGGSPVTIATGTDSPSGIKTDGVNVYWSEFSWPGTVWKVSVNGGTTTALGHNVNNRGVAIDPTSTNVYWGEYVFLDAGKIDYAPTSGGATTSLVTGLNNVWDVAADERSVFWVEDRTGGAVRQVTISGGSPATLASNLAEPVALALDSSNVYWIERNGGGAATGTLKTLPKAPIVQVTVGTSPPGLSFQVDGVGYTSQQTFIWLQGVSHSVTTTANQPQGSGTQAVWKDWTDGGQQSHSISPGFNATYIANFATQYFLTTSATQGGTISPPSGWYDAGTIVPITAMASGGYNFAGFSGNLTGTLTPQDVIMNGPITVSANFTPAPAVTSLSPTSAVAGSAAFTLTVNGTGFISGSKVRWNGIDRTTNFVSATQLTASITAADIATAATAQLAVFNPGPGGGTSNALAFVIGAAGTYLVGDVFPVAASGGDLNGDGDTLDAGEFGDGTLTILDLIYALRAVTSVPGYRPPACSDRFDAMDAFPRDTETTRGGDGILNTVDLIYTLRRVTNVDTSRPQRYTRGPACPAAAPGVVTMGRSPDAGRALATVEFGAAEWGADELIRTPVYLRAVDELALAGLSLALGVEGAPGKPQLRFVASDRAPAPSLVDGDIRGALALAWLGGFHAAAGERVLLGWVDTAATVAGAPAFRLFGLDAAAGDGRSQPLAMPRK
jgi:hypothetical protein